ncbi:MAG: transglycosylase domain-containing protein, partial [Acidimicrobiia bacterium]
MAGRSPIHELETGDRRGRWFVALATLLSIALLASTWVGLFSFLSVSAAYGTFTDLQREYIPETEGMTLNLPDLSRTSRMHAQDGTLLAELHDGRNSEPVSIDEVPEQVIEAILAAEDADFYEHEGIHFQSIAQAAVENLLEVSTRGGSTITQQVVKNNFVGDERSIQRKITEAFVAAELERRYTKDQILEFYLNSVYFGSSAYGINTAAGEFFGKDLAQLNIAEAATLAVLIRNPSYYDPRRRPEFTLQRRDQVIDQMVEEGFITEEQGE